MARSFDSVDDQIDFGSDGSIDDYATSGGMTFCFWLNRPALDAQEIISKQAAAAANGWLGFFRTSNVFRFRYVWVGNNLTDTTTAFTSTTQIFHIAVTYDASAAANNAVMYANGVVDTGATADGAVAATSDAGNPLLLGANNEGDFGEIIIQNFVYYNGIFSAAQVNRARWWGRAGGGMNVYHPLYTTKLGNEGTATANGTATGTTMVPLPTPAVRPGTSMMGMGIGW